MKLEPNHSSFMAEDETRNYLSTKVVHMMQTDMKNEQNN